MGYRIIVCDDNEAFLDVLTIALKERSEFEIVATGYSGHDAICLYNEYHPDVMLIDVQMETMSSGIDAISEIRNKDNNIKLIMLTVFSDDQVIVEALRCGADNYIIKDVPFEEIIRIVMDTMENRISISNDVAKILRNHIIDKDYRKNLQKESFFVDIMTSLSSTEIDILVLLHSGKNKREIATIKSVELGTIKVHIHNILKKTKTDRISTLLKKLDEFQFFQQLESFRKENK